MNATHTTADSTTGNRPIRILHLSDFHLREKTRWNSDPVLEGLARKVVVCGGPGAGNIVKLINNMLCAGQLLLAGEALRLAERGGVNRDDLRDLEAAIDELSSRVAKLEAESKPQVDG